MLHIKSNYVEVMPYDLEKQEVVGDTAIFEGFIQQSVVTRSVTGFHGDISGNHWHTEMKLIGVDGKSELIISGQLHYSADGIWILQQNTKKKHALAVVEVSDEEEWED